MSKNFPSRLAVLPQLSIAASTKILRAALGPRARFAHINQHGVNGIQVLVPGHDNKMCVLVQTFEYGYSPFHALMMAAGLVDEPSKDADHHYKLRTHILAHYTVGARTGRYKPAGQATERKS